jgi:hypothetical protein
MNKLFDRVRLQVRLREILTTWGDQEGYEIIQSALEKEIHYEEYRKRDRIRVVPNSVCRTEPLE